MPQSRQALNGQQSPEKRRPQDQLDLYQDVVDSTAIDPFLDEQNIGLGNYKEREMWQQVESFRHGLYATAAFRRLIEQRSKEETKYWLAVEGWSLNIPDTSKTKTYKGWNQLEDEERKDIWEDELANREGELFDRRRWIERRGEWLFEELMKQQRPEAGRYPHFEAMSELSGYDSAWEPPHNRMLMARHETSRSRGARLIDNVFQRVKETVTDTDDGGIRR